MSEIVKALLNAESNYKDLKKSGSVKIAHKERKWSTLKDILDSTREALRNQDIRIEFIEHKKDDEYLLQTRLRHISGEEIESWSPIFSENSHLPNKSQQYGCALSYAKRYALQTILVIDGGDIDPDDIDYENEERTMENTSTKPASPEQIKYIQGLIKKKQNPTAMYENVLRKYQIKSLEELQSKDASSAIKMLQANP
jgi:hypothetical protein